MIRLRSDTWTAPISPISKMQEMSASIIVIYQQPHAPKLLRSQLNEGAYLALLPGQVRNDRTAPVPSQRRRTSRKSSSPDGL